MKFTKNLKKMISLITIVLTLLNLISSKKGNKNYKQPNFNGRTDKQDRGNGNIHYLDRHDIKCEANQVLQGFRLFAAFFVPETIKSYYKYACVTIPTGKTIQKKTDENILAKNNKKSVNYLDRHDIKCKKGYALQEFKLNSSGKNIFYSYTCVEVNCGKIETENTKAQGDQGYETKALEIHDVRVTSDFVITGFKLVSKNSRFYYEVRKCKLGGGKNPVVQPKPQPVVQPKPVVQPVVQPKPIVQPVVQPKPIVQPVETPQERGMRFCKENCQDNVSGKLHNCRLYKQTTTFKCRRCSIARGLIITSPAFGKSQDSPAIKSVCETFCSAPDLEKTNKQCVFYGFLNLEKKNNFDINILNKFGLKIRRK